MQRGADAELDKFEAYARQHVFVVPADLQLEPPGVASAAEEAAQLDVECAQLEAQLAQAVATKREVKRKVAAAENLVNMWEVHRVSVQQLAAAQRANGALAALEGTQQLNVSIQQGFQMLKTADADGAATTADATAHGPRGLQQRFTQRRAEISTVSVPDLSLLSKMVSAS